MTGSAVSAPALHARICVVVATRNRPVQLRRCIESILGNDHDSFEVIVVDQSDEPTELPPDPRLRTILTTTSGKSAGLNQGIAVARAPVLAFTDDDCLVPSHWLQTGETVLERYPQVVLVFGNLVPVEHDPTAVLVPSADFGRFRIVEGRHSAVVRGGAGANMFARRALYDSIGFYDEVVGPGSRFYACEEFDIYYRALAAGLKVAFAPELAVVHDGGRPYADGSGQLLLRRYALGEGAVIAKHLRLGDTGIVRPAVQIVAGDLGRIVENVRRGRLTGIGVFAYKCWGFLAGLSTSVDRRRRVYRQRRRSAAAWPNDRS